MRVKFKDEDEPTGELLITNVVEITPSRGKNDGWLTCTRASGDSWSRPAKDLIGIYRR